MSIKSPLSRQFGSRFDSVFDVVKSNPVYDKAGRIPTLDLNFAKSKSLYDGRSTKNLIDHVRDTAPNSSTYVDAAGLIKRSVTNLLHYSEEFDQWVKTNTTVTVDSSVELAPDGTATADKIVETAVTDYHYIDNPTPNPTVTNGSVFTASFYVKSAERTTFHAYLISSGIIANSATQFDLSTGKVVSGSQAAIENVGNGWYRCSIYGTANSTVGRIRILLNSNSSYAGDGTSGLYLWGAQLEEASTAGEYVKTTATKSSAPRFDHDPATGESLGLLVEESRENLIIYSEDLTLSPWASNFSGAGATATNETYTAPDGSTTVTKITFNQQYGAHSQSINTSDGVSYTLSGYVKRISGPTAYTFNHFNSATGNGSSGLAATDEWTRFKITVLGRSGGGLVSFGIQTTATSDFGEILVWGAQLEAGSFPTSYIPTESAAVTRGADVTSISGTNFSSWYNQTEGTMFADAISPPTSESTLYRAFGISDGTLNDRFVFYRNGSTNLAQIFVGASGSTQASFTEADWSDNSRLKMIVAARENSINASFGGSSETEDTSASMPTVDRASIGRNETGASSLFWNSTISRLTYWDTRLPNEKLQSTTA